MAASAEWVAVHVRAGKDAPACQAVGWLQHEVGCPNLVYQNYEDLVLIKIPIVQVPQRMVRLYLGDSVSETCSVRNAN